MYICLYASQIHCPSAPAPDSVNSIWYKKQNVNMFNAYHDNSDDIENDFKVVEETDSPHKWVIDVLVPLIHPDI